MSYESEVQAANEAIADADALIQRLHDEIGKAEKARKAQDAATAMVDAELPKLEKDLAAVEANLDASASVNAKVKDALDRAEADAANLVTVAKSTYADAGDAFLLSLADRVNKAITPRVTALRERARLQTNEYSKYGKALAKLKKFLDRAEDAVKNGKADDADTALGDAKDESADLASNLQSSQFEVIRNHFTAKLSAQDARIPKIEADIAALRASSQNAPKTQAAPAPASSTPSPSPLPPGVFPDSIAGSGMKVVSDKIGGTTGAKLVEIDGRRYILKQNRTAAGVYKDGQPSPEHVRNEAAADQAYRRAGIRVPDCRIYEEGGVTYKLSEFIPGGKSLGDYLSSATPAQKKKALDQLAEGYPLDALFGNRDAYGTANFDNILVDKDGNVWRIDNGSAFGFRARGLKKDDSEWKDRQWPDEWRTLRQYNQALFKDLDAHAIFTNFNRLDIDAALNGLPDDVKKAMEKPLAEMRELGARCTEFDRGKYQPAHTSAVLEASYDLCKDGLREIMPKQIVGDSPSGDAAFGMLRVRNGGGNIQPDDTPASKIIHAAISIGHHINTGDFTPNSDAIDAALKLKPQLEAAAAWDPNAKTLLAAIAEIEKSQKGGFKTAISHVNQVGVYLSDPSAQATGRTFWDCVESVAASTGVDARTAPQYFRSQGGSSGSLGSLKLKAIELDAMGADLSDLSSVRGLWIRPGLEKVVKHYQNNPAEFERDKKSYALFKAATQIVLENTDFETRDLATRTVRLLRTSEKDTLGLKPGEIGEYADDGAHESFGTLHSVEVHCEHAYIRDVPFSRISSIYFTTTSVDEHNLYLGDGENETGANVIGLPAFYVGNVNRSTNITGAGISYGTRIRDFDKFIKDAEAKSGKSLRD